MWDLSSLTKDQTVPSALEARSLKHWTAREVPFCPFFDWVVIVVFDIEVYELFVNTCYCLCFRL